MVTRLLHHARGPVMGTSAHVVVVGGDERLPDHGMQRLRDLEARWSRFVPTSEVQALNRGAGRPVPVSPDTCTLVERAVTAWRLTGGRCDPTVGAALVALGYDRDFALLPPMTVGRPAPVRPAPGLGGVRVDREAGTVALGEGVVFDPGGIGKGLAADLTAAELLAGGADGVLVNVGGDLRALGTPPADEGWAVSVPDPVDADRERLRFALPAGAVATSSTHRRRWTTTAGPVHHLLDPTTGCPAAVGVVQATVVAAEGWWAEAVAKVVVLDGLAALHRLEGAHGFVVTTDGGGHATAGLRAAVR